MSQKKNTPASAVALGGVLAALAVVIMSISGIIPILTYVSPMLCAVMLQTVMLSCGSRIAWAWYGAVAILAALLSADKEAAATFIFLGYYPLVKPKFDRMHLKNVWKILFFNGSTFLMYFILLHLLGMAALREEFVQTGAVMLIVLLVMGNITFILLDRLLQRGLRLYHKN